MNKTETIAAIKVMQAYVDGKNINPKGGSVVNEPMWDWFRNDYSVKPEPIEIYVNIYENDASLYLHSSKEEAERASAESQSCKTVLFREVIE